MSPPRDEPLRNRLLAGIPEGELRRLRPHLRRVQLAHGEVLIDPNQAIEHVWFPEDCMVSMLSLTSDGGAVEVATVGCEGMVGVPVFLGASTMVGQAFAQSPGAAFKLPARVLRDEVRRGGALTGLLGRYTHSLLTLIAQCAACNLKHTVQQRCARWLLMTHDRVEGDSFALTHLFLSQMLGVRRATVTEAAGALQKAGLVEYGRGEMTVVDRVGLERASCECYHIIAAEFARHLDGTHAPSPLDGVQVSEHGRTITGDGAPAGTGTGDVWD